MNRCTSCGNTGSVGSQLCKCPSGAEASRRAQANPRTRQRLDAILVEMPVMTDPITERRLLAAMIAETAVLALTDDIEDQDFSDPRCRAVLAAIRRLRADGADVGINEIDHEIKLQDMDRAGEGRTSLLAEKAGFWFLVELLSEFTPYRGEQSLTDHDMAWLRSLADGRRALRSAA